ncbi:class D beta-lactamase [Polaribacter batillariae]|uniref:Beta-lactamase n=1 Tax=Polaribacter batillariae TaxID=2808900 RepID=A0ABX7SSL7_9FLAO|nr:class D beta-lactamase [Polaribacter batillariae]QTD37252.1 class D beta-lactamase [Polaribacter batillariae]
MKKILFILFISVLIFSCSKKQKVKNVELKYVKNKELESILKNNNLEGAILIYDAKQKKYYSNNFVKAKEAYLPASTFKIPNTIIGLETGFIKNEQFIFKWNGESRAMSIWEKDLSLKEAFQSSCVPCYQELARSIGVEKMNKYLQKLSFGDMDVNSETIDSFWLLGNSKITPFQQIDFLTRLYNNKLPVSKSTSEIVKNILKIDVFKKYILRGKTGLAINEEKDAGWFVGYVEINKSVYYFATIITPKEEMIRRDFIPLRKEISMLALKELEIIDE